MMKKFIAVLFTLIILVVMTTMCACNTVKEPPVESNVSREVLAFYAGENEDFAVFIDVIKKEKSFIADGRTIDVVNSAELNIMPLKVHDNSEYVFAITDGTSTLTGTIKGNQFGEYRQDITIDFVPTSITIGEGECAQTIALADILQGKLTSADVINIAEKEFEERILKEKESGEYNREIYVKLISGDRQHYYYYVSYIGEGVDYWALLLDPETGAVVSKK
jgi:Zn-dependent metalloprotease